MSDVILISHWLKTEMPFVDKHLPRVLS